MVCSWLWRPFRDSGDAADTRGTAFVVYEDIYDAKNAVDHLSGFNVLGRYLIVLYYQASKMQQRMDTEKKKKELDELRCVSRLLISELVDRCSHDMRLCLVAQQQGEIWPREEDLHMKTFAVRWAFTKRNLPSCLCFRRSASVWRCSLVLSLSVPVCLHSHKHHTSITSFVLIPRLLSFPLSFPSRHD